MSDPRVTGTGSEADKQSPSPMVSLPEASFQPRILTDQDSTSPLPSLQPEALGRNAPKSLVALRPTF